MYVTVKITPQRIIVLLSLILIWYCLISTSNTVDRAEYHIDAANTPSILEQFKSVAQSYITPDPLGPTSTLTLNHHQRVLRSSDSSTVYSLNAANEPNGEIFHIKYPPIPSVVGIGPEKCGTTSMSYMLTRHSDKIPEVIKPLHEPTGIDGEMRVWLPCGNSNLKESLENVIRDGIPTKPENYCSLGWYQHFWTPHHDDVRYLHYYLHFMNATRPFTRIVNYNNSSSALSSKNIIEILGDNELKYESTNPLSWRWRYYYYFEKSPAYWCYEHVAYLFGQLLAPQGTKFFVMARDPIKRSFSYYSHQTQIGRWRGNWDKYINEGLNDQHIQKMVGLMKDEARSLMDIKGELLKYWKQYVYDSGRGYGYIGHRDAGHKAAGRPRKMGRHLLGGNEGNLSLREEIVDKWRRSKRDGRAFIDGERRRLWSGKDPGYVKADTNPNLGIGASCYVVPLLMWLEHIPSAQVVVMQSELMYGGNHNRFISDVRCWMSLGYEYNTMEECRQSGKKEVEVGEEHKTISARTRVKEEDARKLYDGLYKYCNQRLRELMEIEEFAHLAMHDMQWDKWFS